MLDAERVEKLDHHFEEKQKVKLRHKDGSVPHGKIESINARGLLNILLDSGHHVMAHPSLDQVEPEDFEPQGSDYAVSRVQKQTNYDPFPGLGALAEAVFAGGRLRLRGRAENP